MALAERGAIKLDDPVTRWLLAFRPALFQLPFNEGRGDLPYPGATNGWITNKPEGWRVLG